MASDKKSAKLQRKFFRQMDDYLDDMGIDIDYEADVRKKKAIFSAEFAGFDVDFIIKTKKKNDWNQTKSMKMNMEFGSENVTIKWKFDDIMDASHSIAEVTESGEFDDAINLLASDGDIEEFNEFIEDLSGFKDSKIV